MSGITQPTRIRKSLVAINGTDQRKSFFYALKLLGVLPPPKGSDFSSWTFTSVAGTQNYKPKCLHDILIGSHATSCQHTTVYFAFYHRHLMIILQIFLNFAHQILKGGFPTLGESYPPSIKFKDTEPFKSIVGFKFNSTTQFDFLYQGSNITYWGTVFSTYKGFQGVPEQIACHYWAPTNFLQQGDLTIPAELAPRSSSSEPIDVLFNGINKSYPWEINTQRRWFNTPSQYNKTRLPFPVKNPPLPYSNNQEKFLNGQLDPRLNPTVFRLSTGQTASFLGNYLSNNSSMVRYRTYAAYDDTKKNFRLNAVEERQSLANYGAKNKNLQYITQAQKSSLISKGYGGSWIQNYNAALPHYQYASALFHSVRDFFEGTGTNGIQRSHNYMHNNFKYILSDARYSVTSLLFYTYHSWIDAMLQFKLREGNSTSRRPSYDYFYTLLNEKYAKIPTGIQGKLKDQFAQVSQLTSSMSRWFLSGTNEIPSDVAGRYPILEWYSSSSNMSFSFCSRDYILTKTDIRTSQKFNQIYHFPQYVQLFGSRYAFYKNLSKFNYNYNYQIGSSTNDRNNLLNEFATNIPQYLQDMYKDIIGKDYPKQRSLLRAIEVQKAVAKVQSSEEQEQLSLEVRKLFLGNVEMFASFPPSTENGSNPVVLKLKNVLKDLSKYLNEHQLQEIQNYVFNGVQASDIFIFGKQQNAQECQRCQDLKGEFLNLDDDLRIRIPQIWKHLHIASLNEIYYDSESPEKEPKCIYNKLDLVPNPKFTAYRFVTGAEEIFIDVKSNIRTKEAKFIRLDTESYSVRTNTIKIVASKKHQTFHTNFDFYKLFDVDNESERSYFDRYVYKQLRGWVSVGSERVKFQINIPSFQRVLRLTLYIENYDDKLHVKIVDTDYATKLAYYESYQESTAY